MFNSLKIGAVFTLIVMATTTAHAHATPPPPLSEVTEQAVVNAGVEAPVGDVPVNSNTLQMDALTIELPQASDQSVERNGRRYWEAADSGEPSTVAQSTSTGVQIMSVFLEPSAVLEARYELPGTELHINGEGAVPVVRDGVLEAYIDTPWARDASGRALPTHFRVDGSSLVQVVETDSATVFPVVADPNVIKTWFGWQVQLSRDETARVGASAGGCASVAALIAPPAGPYIAVGCGALSAQAALALSFGKCLAINVYVNAALGPWYWNC